MSLAMAFLWLGKYFMGIGKYSTINRKYLRSIGKYLPRNRKYFHIDGRNRPRILPIVEMRSTPEGICFLSGKRSMRFPSFGHSVTHEAKFARNEESLQLIGRKHCRFYPISSNTYRFAINTVRMEPNTVQIERILSKSH